MSETRPGPPNAPLMYSELAEWWPLLSPPEDYREEARFYLRHLLADDSDQQPTLLELGSGGGSNASHLKEHFRITLVDLSPDMLAVSRALNPECEHVLGDMRGVRLARQFDAVFVHDAVAHMTEKEDLARAIETAYVHCRQGGLALFAPDHTRESFQPSSDHGGVDGNGRALRYLEWTHAPDDGGSTYHVDYAYMLREGDAPVRLLHERHTCGLFRRGEWLELLQGRGFEARIVTEPREGRDLFAASRA